MSPDNSSAWLPSSPAAIRSNRRCWRLLPDYRPEAKAHRSPRHPSCSCRLSFDRKRAHLEPWPWPAAPDRRSSPHPARPTVGRRGNCAARPTARPCGPHDRASEPPRRSASGRASKDTATPHLHPRRAQAEPLLCRRCPANRRRPPAWSGHRETPRRWSRPARRRERSPPVAPRRGALRKGICGQQSSKGQQGRAGNPCRPAPGRQQSHGEQYTDCKK